MRRHSLNAFTLIELLVVMAIIGILIAITTTSFLPTQRKARDAKRKSDLSQFESSLKLFESDFKVFPNYTFNLGAQGNATDGDTNSDLGLQTDVVACNSLSPGDPALFTTTANHPTMAALTNVTAGATKIKLKPGFAATNQLLICLKYADRLFTDPTYTGLVGFHYRVAYDYSSYLVSAQLENTADPSALSQLFTGGGNDGETMANKRFFDGNGRSTRQLDDDTATQDDFYHFTANGGSASDGKYFYQCVADAANAAIKPDDRSDPSKNPITTDSNGNWVANSTGCQTPVADGNAVAVASQ